MIKEKSRSGGQLNVPRYSQELLEESGNLSHNRRLIELILFSCFHLKAFQIES